METKSRPSGILKDPELEVPPERREVVRTIQAFALTAQPPPLPPYAFISNRPLIAIFNHENIGELALHITTATIQNIIILERIYSSVCCALAITSDVMINKIS